MAPRQDPELREAVGYGFGSLGTGLFSTVPSVLLLYFCTEILARNAAVAGLILMLPKLGSMLWDPAVGLWSDSTQGRLGRRTPFLLAGAIGGSISFALLFAPPPLSTAGTTIWIGAAYVLFAAFYSLYAVPYTALPAELAFTMAGTSRLVTVRMLFVMIGIFAGAAIAPFVVAAAGGGRSAYALMGLVLGLGSLPALLAPVPMVSRRLPEGTAGPRPAQPALFEALRDIWADAGFRRLAFAFLALAAAFGSVAALLPYVVTRGLGRPETDIGWALGAMVGATVVGLPIWHKVAVVFGHRRALDAARLGYAGGAILLGGAPLAEAGWTVCLAAMGLAGSQFAGLQLMPFALVADHVRRYGASAEARYSGVWTAFEKLGIAIGAALLGAVLSCAGNTDAILFAGFLILAPPTLVGIALILLANRGIQP